MDDHVQMVLRPWNSQEIPGFVQTYKWKKDP